MQNQPFARANAIMKAIAAAAGLPIHLQGAAMNMIPVYKSRGKGRGAWPSSDRTAAQDKRAARKARNVRRHKAALKG